MMLNDRNWRAFQVKHLFRVEKCKCSNASKLKKGNFPYVGATNRNNGVLSFVEKKNKLITKGNCIVFICDGQGSVGYSIYKKEDFIGSTTLKVGYNEHLNRYTAIFLVSALDKNKQIYSYGYKRKDNRLLNERIMLPVDENNNPDYQFMEDYVKELEQKKRDEYIKYCQQQLKIFGGGYRLIPLADKQWKSFFIVDVFDKIQRGKRLKTADHIVGEVPYISSSALNNGVDNFVSNNKGVRKFSDCLSLANSGSVGSCFYEPFEFVASDHITHLKSKALNKYHYLFLATMTGRLSQKYNFNREINDKRISREIILLPITDKGEPDYEYMEKYSKNMLREKVDSYINYVNDIVS